VYHALFATTYCSAEQSRRDDLESLGYLLLYFFSGSLPWQGLGNPPKKPGMVTPVQTKKQKYSLIREKKISTPVEQLCKGLPGECCICAAVLCVVLGSCDCSLR
jgi:hypothetical protein